MKINIKKTPNDDYDQLVTIEPDQIVKDDTPERKHIGGSIYIEETDPKLLTDITLLVDIPGFLTDIKMIRREWKITSYPRHSGILIDESLLKHVGATMLVESQFAKDHREALKHITNTIQKIRKRYNRTKNYDPVILWSIFCHWIPKGIYKSCYFDTIPINGENPNDPKSYQYAIILDGRTEKEELLKAFKDFKDYQQDKAFTHYLKETVSDKNLSDFEQAFVSFEKNGSYAIATDKEKVRKKNTILLIRELYWKKKSENITYYDLAKYANDKCDKHEIKRKGGCMYCNATYSSVKENILDYSEHLKK